MRKKEVDDFRFSWRSNETRSEVCPSTSCNDVGRGSAVFYTPKSLLLLKVNPEEPERPFSCSKHVQPDGVDLAVNLSNSATNVV